MTWLLYGANGYTGKLIAEEAARRGHKPVLAGRTHEAIVPLAERLGLPHRVFPLDDAAALRAALESVKAVLHCAGPFSRTNKPVLSACLELGRHYLDITGEIAVFERCFRRDADAKARGCVVMPGVGFDVVPSDCLAARLKQALPEATSLELAFAGGGVSGGTLKTMVEGLHHGSAVRRDGKIEIIGLGSLTREVPFRDRPRFAVAIPWGDVSTAFHSTGIPNITVYLAMNPQRARALKLMNLIRPLLASPRLIGFLQQRIGRAVRGPSEEARQTKVTQLWGRVAGGGRSIEATLQVPEGYALTVQSSLAALERVLADKVAPGTHTPSMAFGAGFIETLPGCNLQIS